MKCGAITLLILNTFTHLSLRSSDPHASTGHWVNVLISLGVTSLSALPTGQIRSGQAQPTSFFPVSVSWILIFSFFFPRFFVLLPAATAAATMSCPPELGFHLGNFRNLTDGTNVVVLCSQYQVRLRVADPEFLQEWTVDYFHSKKISILLHMTQSFIT